MKALSENWLNPDRKWNKQLNALLAGRQSLDDVNYYNEYFKDSEIPFEIVSRTRKRIICQLGEFYSLLQPDDDWSKDFRAIWMLDSLGDVELLLALEEEFEIVIPESMAAQMVTPRKIMAAIHQIKHTSPRALGGHSSRPTNDA